MDHNFGLPKPDFQAPPKKKVLWPVLVVSIIFAPIAAIIAYNFYFRILDQKKTTPISEIEKNKSSENHLKKKSKSSESQAILGTKTDKHIDEQVNQFVRDSEDFEHKQNNKVKKSISATQKQLEIKQKKPLVKPGTYQELKEPQGIYHLLVFTHLEKRSAMQVVQRLIKKNLGVCLILPRINKGERYYRVTIGHSRTQYEAEQKYKQLQSTHNTISIFKY